MPGQAAVEREREVILREMEEVDNQIEEVVFDRLHEVAYVGTPLARTILGPKENIKSIMADDIVKYIKTHYTAPRMVLAASGAVNHDELVSLSGDFFGGVPSVAPDGLTFDFEASLFSGADVRVYNDEMELGHFALAVEGELPIAACEYAGASAHTPSPVCCHASGLCWTDPDVFSLMLCQSLLGTYDRKSLTAQFSAAPLSSKVAKMDYVHSMQPFCECPCL